MYTDSEAMSERPRLPRGKLSRQKTIKVQAKSAQLLRQVVDEEVGLVKNELLKVLLPVAGGCTGCLARTLAVGTWKFTHVEFWEKEVTSDGLVSAVLQLSKW